MASLEQTVTRILLGTYRAHRVQCEPLIERDLWIVRARWHPSDRTIQYELTGMELHSGRDVDYWLRELSRAAEHEYLYNEGQINREYGPRFDDQLAAQRRQADEQRNAYMQAMSLQQQQPLRNDQMDALRYAMQNGAMGFAQSPRIDDKAEKRAKELFLMTAGADALAKVQSSKGLPLKGSAGTAYTLHARRTFCIERVKDKAKLCAVVPNVPLYDHLLGIKLMVENDEPKFLKTANVSTGGMVNLQMLGQQAPSPYNQSSLGQGVRGVGSIFWI